MCSAVDEQLTTEAQATTEPAQPIELVPPAEPSDAPSEPPTHEPAPVEVYTMPDGTETTYRCRICGTPFLPVRVTAFTVCGKPECRRLIRGTVTCQSCGRTVPRKSPRQRTCGEMACRDKLREMSTDRIIKNRERCLRWYTDKGLAVNRNPWLFGPPVYDPHLPGGGCVISVHPAPRWPMDHRNVRVLHGMMTAIIDEGHEANDPTFELVPWNCRFGWGAYIWDVETARKLAGRTFDARIADQDVSVTLSPLWRMKAPKIEKRGHRKLRIDALTPVCSSSYGRSIIHTCPTTDTLMSALTNRLPDRLGLERYGFSKDHVKLELVGRKHEVGSVFMSGKYGVVKGWIGHCIVDTNAVGHWLLKACETVGLGGRVAFGFGRIKVTEVDDG